MAPHNRITSLHGWVCLHAKTLGFIHPITGSSSASIRSCRRIHPFYRIAQEGTV